MTHFSNIRPTVCQADIDSASPYPVNFAQMAPFNYYDVDVITSPRGPHAAASTGRFRHYVPCLCVENRILIIL